jgi:hypothetical protein
MKKKGFDYGLLKHTTVVVTLMSLLPSEITLVVHPVGFVGGVPVCPTGANVIDEGELLVA